MRKKSYEQHKEKRRMPRGKRIVGVASTKEKHQRAVVNEDGIQQGKSFILR